MMSGVQDVRPQRQRRDGEYITDRTTADQQDGEYRTDRITADLRGISRQVASVK